MSLYPRQNRPAYQLRPPRPSSSSSSQFNEANDAPQPLPTSIRSSWATSFATLDSEESQIKKPSVSHTVKPRRKLSRLFGPFRPASTRSRAEAIDNGITRECTVRHPQAAQETSDVGALEEDDCLQNEMAVMQVAPSLLRPDPRTQQSPLLRAIATRDRDAISSLLEREPRLLHCRHGKQGYTPLIFAIITRDDDIFELLVNHGANLKTIDLSSRRSPIEWAVINCHRYAVHLILEKEPALINMLDKDGLSLPSLAYENHETDLARFFIESGAAANSRTRGGLHILIEAIKIGDRSFAQLLIGEGAEPNCKDRDGTPALILAIQMGHEYLAMSLINALLSRGGRKSLDARDSKGATALMWALSRNNNELAGHLVFKGASTEAQDRAGFTVRQYAAKMNSGHVLGG